LSTLKIVSEFCKLLLPFLGAFYTGLCAYLDTYRGWKLASSMLLTIYLTAIGATAVHNWLSS
jgi:hypothetical protein